MFIVCRIERSVKGTGAKFLVPDWGDKVDYGIGLSYRPASQNWPQIT
jgi:hypothetical protein